MSHHLNREEPFQIVKNIKGGETPVYFVRAQHGVHMILKKDNGTESKILQNVSHPGIAAWCGNVVMDEDSYFLEEFVPGENLYEWVRAHGPAPEQISIGIALQVCEILSYLQNREPPVIHRDIKPHNLILQPDGQVKLIDFGIARYYLLRENTDTHNFGTPGFAAPEQYADCMGQSDTRADLYGLGATLYYLLTKDDPADFSNEGNRFDFTSEIRKNIQSPELAEILCKCTDRNPEHRFSGAEALVYALKQYLQKGNAMKTEQKQKKKRETVNPAALALWILSLAVYAGGFLLGLGYGMQGAEAFAFWQAGLIWGIALLGGTLLMGFAQIIKLLQQIRNRMSD